MCIRDRCHSHGAGGTRLAAALHATRERAHPVPEPTPPTGIHDKQRHTGEQQKPTDDEDLVTHSPAPLLAAGTRRTSASRVSDARLVGHDRDPVGIHRDEPTEHVESHGPSPDRHDGDRAFPPVSYTHLTLPTILRV